jgi:putative peptidoglycan lipid II flippase
LEDDTTKTTTISTSIVMICTLLSRLLGFLRIALIGAYFGASGQADVLNAVFTIPNNLRKLLAEGALSSAFIPVLSRSLIEDPSLKRSRKIVQKVITIQFLIIIPLLIVSILFSKGVTGILLHFPEAELNFLASRLFRYLINYLLLISVSAVLMGVINTHSSFFIPAFSPILFSVCVILSVVFFHKQLGIFSMAIGVLAGGLAQVLFQYPKFQSFGYSFKLNFDFKDEDFRRIIRQWLPVLFTASIFTVNQQIAFRFASALEDGSASALSNALVFWQLPFGIFSASITTVLFPKMSKQWAAGNTGGIRESLQFGLRYNIVLLLPAAVILSLLNREIISVALQRGQFNVQNTLLASKVLTAYCFGLIGVGLYNFFQRFFYSIGNYRIPFFTSIFTTVLDILLSLWLKETHLRVVGLAVANSLAFTSGFVIFIIYANRKIGSIGLKPILFTLIKSAITCGVAAFFILIYLQYTGEWWVSGSSLNSFLKLSIVGGISILIILVLYYVFKIEIVMNILSRRKKDAAQ